MVEETVLLTVLGILSDLYKQQVEDHWAAIQVGGQVPIGDDDDDTFLLNIGMLHDAHDLHKSLTEGARA